MKYNQCLICFGDESFESVAIQISHNTCYNFFFQRSIKTCKKNSQTAEALKQPKIKDQLNHHCTVIAEIWVVRRRCLYQRSCNTDLWCRTNCCMLES